MKSTLHAIEQLVFLAAVVLLLALLGSAQEQRPPGASNSEFEWRFSVKMNQTASSNITAQNICRKRHRFEVETRGLPPFMRLKGESSFQVEPHSEHNFPVEFSSTGLQAGVHQGEAVVRCTTCRQEKTCTQDREVLHIYMTVQPDAEAHAAAQNAAANPAAPPFVPGRVLAVVAFDSDSGVSATAKKLAAAHSMDVVEVHRLKSLNAAVVVFALHDGDDVLAKAAALAPDVMLTQPDFIYETSSAMAQDAAPSGELQYGPRLIGAHRVRRLATGQGVKIALIDTGVDAAHPALQGKIAEQVDVTGKGFTSDAHGTLLAGIMVGEPAQGTGISGIAPRSELLAIKACHPQAAQSAPAQCWSLTLAKGVDYAIEKKARIINLSLSGPEDKLLARLVDTAVARGVVVVAAGGNGGVEGRPSFPAAMPDVIAVTAVDAKDQLYSSATRGDYIDLAAPGVEIISTAPGGKLLVSSGTSLATAFVSGAAALLLQQQPQLSPQALQSLLEQTAKDLGPPGKDPQFGSGRLDICRALAQIRHDPKLCR